MTGWAIGSIAIGVAIIAFHRQILRAMAAADDEPFTRRLSEQVGPSLRVMRGARVAWMLVIAAVFIAMGLVALL